MYKMMAQNSIEKLKGFAIDNYFPAPSVMVDANLISLFNGSRDLT